MSAPTRILLVEDSRSDARLLEATLQDAGIHRFRLTHVERLDEALAALGDGALLARLIRHAVERHQIGVELERARAEQIRLRDQFLTHVSHELRTPLAAMHQFLDILADGLAGALSDEQQAYVQRTLRNARQLEGMVAELLDAVRAETGKLAVTVQPVELAPLVEDTVGGFAGRAADKAIHLSAAVQPGLAAEADAGRVGQVLGNLLDNALKFTPEGGEVRVSALADGDPGFARVEVTDSGPGVPADAAERIFERLWQVEDDAGPSRKGLGIGLHICRELVARQGGRIWVDSPPGEGATFAFTLPLDQKGADRSIRGVTVEASAPR